MALKEIKWIENQMEKLNAPDFDIDAWKSSACLMLDGIFGEGNHRSSQLAKLDNRFNSWSLRDATGNESYEERNQRMATEILQSAIDELEISGITKKNNEVEQVLNELLTIIFDEMKGTQVKKLKMVLTLNLPVEEKKRQVADIMREAGDGNNILTHLLLHQAIGELLKKG